MEGPASKDEDRDERELYRNHLVSCRSLVRFKQPESVPMTFGPLISHSQRVPEVYRYSKSALPSR